MTRLTVEDLRALTSLSGDRKTIHQFLERVAKGRSGRSANRYVTISIGYNEDVDEFFKTYAARIVDARNSGDKRAGNDLMKMLRTSGPDEWAAQSPKRKEHHVNMAYARINHNGDFEMHVLSVPISKEYHAFDNVKVHYTTLGFLLDSKWYFDPLDKALEHVQAQEQELLKKVAAEVHHRSSFGGFNFAGVTKEIHPAGRGCEADLGTVAADLCHHSIAGGVLIQPHTDQKAHWCAGCVEDFEVYLDTETRLPKALRLGNALVCPWDIDHADGKVVANERPLEQEELIDAESFLSKMGETHPQNRDVITLVVDDWTEGTLPHTPLWLPLFEREFS